jgi:predicted neuraminidase
MLKHTFPTKRLALLVFMGIGAALAAGGFAHAAAARRVNLSPGPEYADESRMFQGIPTLERSSNGRLWAAWYGGGVTEDKHNYVVLATSGDDGQTWQRVLVVDPDGDGPVRAFDPCLWHDPKGRLWLFWAERGQGPVPETLAITTADSNNAAAEWSEPRRLFEGIMINKPTVAKDGRWLLPTALWQTEGSARVVASSDDGAKFARIGAANVPVKADRNCDEPMLVQRRDDALWLLVRTRYGIGQSVSTDGGKTWPDVTPTGIAHPATRFYIRRLASGRLLLVRHNPPGGANARSHLSAFLSEDDGQTWKGGLLLDERRNVSYPDGAQSADGMIYLIYDFERQRDKQILMAVFDENDVLQGKVTSPKGRLRAQINQAGGVNPTIKPRAGLANNADGVALLSGPAPAVEFGEGQADVLNPGVKLFLDRTYGAMDVPEALRGRKFVRFNITGGRVTCQKPGVVYVATPSAGRQRDSLAESLLKKGFVKTTIPEFMIFEGEQNISSVFQKQLAKDEVLTIDKWGILVLAGEAAR